MEMAMKASIPLSIEAADLAVSTQGLIKRFGAKQALAGLELTVPQCAVYALVGQNGSGKTTTFKILLDLLRPTTGVATVFGLDAQADGPRIRSSIGYVPEQQTVGYGWMSAERLIRHQAAYFPRWDWEYASRLMRELSIPLRRKFGRLSKGEARRVQLIMALAHRPALLLLDEPTDGLDPLARDQVLQILAAHQATSPATVLVATHYVHIVEGLADHIGVIHEGRFIAQSRRDLLQRYLRRYRAAVPEGWAPAATGGTVAGSVPDFNGSVVQRRAAPGEIAWVVWGEEAAVTENLTRIGAEVREVSALSLEETAVALLGKTIAE